MSSYSSNGEVFGAKALYGVMVALSAAVLFAAVASTLPSNGSGQAVASAPHGVETVVVTAASAEVS